MIETEQSYNEYVDDNSYSLFKYATTQYKKMIENKVKIDYDYFIRLNKWVNEAESLHQRHKRTYYYSYVFKKVEGIAAV